jgi:diguanylate cyclase (GGDEF)-like protein
MPDPSPPAQRLLPTVSIVEETMRQALRAVSLALACTALLTVTLLAERLWSSAQLEHAADRHAQANRLAGEIRLAEQELLQAAQSAALTGEASWIERYDRLTANLTQKIDHASLLVPLTVAQRYREKTHEASADIAQMRQSALNALNSGALDAARTLFDGERYTSRSKTIRDATEELTAISLAATERQMRELRTRSYIVAGVALTLTLGGGFFLWRRLSSGLHESRGSLLEAEVRVQRLAASDLLTGLDNRAALHDAMQARLARATKHNQEISVLMVDLDRFKPVNDRNGHMVGDLVLKEVALRLGRSLRQSDLRARYGGDEFVVVIDESDGKRTARAAAERIIETLSEPMFFGDLMVNIGASIGEGNSDRAANAASTTGDDGGVSVEFKHGTSSVGAVVGSVAPSGALRLAAP